MSWICTRCGLNNIAANKQCADTRCKAIRPENYNDDYLSAVISDNVSRSLMEQDRAELHAQFFHHESILVKDMDYVTLKTHREELERIAFEARARLTAVDAEERTRKASMSKEQREGLISRINPDPNVTDAINIVAERKKRMSKADKLLADMKALGIENAEELMKNVKVDAGKTYGRPLVDKQTYTFNGKLGTTTNTQESLLGDICTSIVNGIDTRPIDDLYNSARTAGHIAILILSRNENVAFKSEQDAIMTKTAEPSAKPSEPFDPSSLFGK